MKYTLRIYIFLVLPFLFSSCGTVSKNVVEDSASQINEKEKTISLNVNFNPDDNILYHQGWKISAPPECSFQAPLKANKENELFRVCNDQTPLFSLNEIIFHFKVDHGLLIDYTEKEIRSNFDNIEKGLFKINSPDNNRLESDYWIYGENTVMLEKIDNQYFEWRLSCPLTGQDSLSKASVKMIKEAEIISKDVSGRLQKNGFSFISHGGPWRWRGDIGDGFLLDCLVPEDSPGLIAVLCSIDEIDETGDWFSYSTAAPEKTVPVHFILNGEKIISEILVNNVEDSFGRKEYIRLVIPVAESNLHKKVCIFFYYEVLNETRPDPEVIFNSDQIQHLLKYDITLPSEVL